MMKSFPIIDLAATGSNIRQLRIERGLSVRDLQSYFGFEEPQAIYKWQRGESLPTVDNLYALGALLQVPMEQILVEARVTSLKDKQQADACCFHLSVRIRCLERENTSTTPKKFNLFSDAFRNPAAYAA